MKPSTILLAASSMLLSGCASYHRPADLPTTSPVGVIRAVTGAQTAVARLAPHVTPEGAPILASVEEALAQAQAELTRYASAVDQIQKARQAAEIAAEMWHAKQVKALRELWFWRGLAALIIGGSIAAVGIRTGWKFAL